MRAHRQLHVRPTRGKPKISALKPIVSAVWHSLATRIIQRQPALDEIVDPWAPPPGADLWDASSLADAYTASGTREPRTVRPGVQGPSVEEYRAGAGPVKSASELVAESGRTPARAAGVALTRAELFEIVGQGGAARAKGHEAQLDAYLAHVATAFRAMKIDTIEAQAAYLAHAAGETIFATLSEGQKTPFIDNPEDVVFTRDPAGPLRYKGSSSIDPLGQIDAAKNPAYAQTFIGRGPVQVTHEYNYVRTLVYMEEMAKRSGAADAALIWEAVKAIKQDPRQAANLKYSFLFSAAFMHMSGGVRASAELPGATPTFSGQDAASRWVAGGGFDIHQNYASTKRALELAKQGGDPENIKAAQAKFNEWAGHKSRADIKAAAYRRALAVLRRKTAARSAPEIQRKTLANREPAAVGGAVERVLRSSGQPLDSAARGFMETRLNQDFSGVRVHTGAEAGASAHAVRARAYTHGHHIVFGAGQFAPHTPDGRRLLAHELAHVIQQGGAMPRHGGVVQRDADLTAAAHYPNVAQQREIQETLNPIRAAGGGTPDPVVDPQIFEQQMLTTMDTYIDRVLPGAEARRDSGLEVSHGGVQEVADIAENAVLERYRSYIQTGGTAPAQHLRETFHEVPTTYSAETDNAVRFWVESRMLQEGRQLVTDHNVVGGTPACATSPPASGWPAECRDRELWVRTRDAIISARRADLRTIILFFPAYERDETAYIQRRIAAVPGMSGSGARRVARWKILHSLIHEYLHTVTHPDFRSAARQLEASSLAVEGFTEYFTGPVYLGLKRRAESESIDDSIRMDIEGDLGPDFAIPDHHTSSRYYQQYNPGIERIRGLTNEESLRVAYFMGRVEYLGLGSWNVQEADRHETARHPANVINLGVGALFLGNDPWGIHASYARVFLGRGGEHQLQAGGEIGYLSEGQRIQAGPNLFYEYRPPYVYVRPGLGLLGSATTEDEFTRSFRLDLVPSLEAGVRLSIFRIGAEGRLLLPVARGEESPRGVGGFVGGVIGLEL